MEYEVIGWLENVSLPLLKLNPIKAKIDTGAKSSALHAEDIGYVTVDNKKYVEFIFTHEDGVKSKLKAIFVEERGIRSSTGQVTVRPVIKAQILMGLHKFDTEFTLIDRSLMRFKMIIGRDTLDHKFIVDPSATYLLNS
ncbi:MAG: hypothetical protein D4R98_02670 [Comamonadaceae bacterium]|nr:MAG: hypothetical protein D4R98_02670 [Comamonadaceae bacterium]